MGVYGAEDSTFIGRANDVTVTMILTDVLWTEGEVKTETPTTPDQPSTDVAVLENTFMDYYGQTYIFLVVTSPDYDLSTLSISLDGPEGTAVNDKNIFVYGDASNHQYGVQIQISTEVYTPGNGTYTIMWSDESGTVVAKTVYVRSV
jgi:hypothetical protein